MEIRAPRGTCWFTSSECVKYPHFSKVARVFAVRSALSASDIACLHRKRLVDTGHADLDENEVMPTCALAMRSSALKRCCSASG
eukprot:2593560-Rhodomonas_salina.7